MYGVSVNCCMHNKCVGLRRNLTHFLHCWTLWLAGESTPIVTCSQEFSAQNVSGLLANRALARCHIEIWEDPGDEFTWACKSACNWRAPSRFATTTVPEELMAATRSLPSPFLVAFSTCYCYERKIEEVWFIQIRITWISAFEATGKHEIIAETHVSDNSQLKTVPVLKYFARLSGILKSLCWQL